MLRRLFWISFWFLLAGAGIGLWLLAIQQPSAETISSLPVSFKPAATPPPFAIVLAQSDSASQDTHLLSCATGKCRLLVAPSQAIDPVTNGTDWFFYTEKSQPGTKETIRVLQRQDASGQVQVINSETPLVRPRDLYISPDGKKVAFWLDNSNDTVKQLTELWVYDSETKGAKVIAEKVHVPDVYTPPRWNSASTMLWFIGNTAPAGKTAQIDCITASVDEPHVQARFGSVNWADAARQAQLTDISQDGEYLAAATSQDGQGQLAIVHEGAKGETMKLRGSIPFLQWLEDNSLVYAVQDSRGVSFWRVQQGVHRYVARQNGTLLAAHSDLRAAYLPFIASTLGGQHQFVLDFESGLITDIGSVPGFGDSATIAQVEQISTTPGAVAGATTAIDDEELLAFIETHITEMVQSPGARASRVIMTDEPNTVYVEYRTANQEQGRILVGVRDVLHPEWSVRGKYKLVGVEWQKVQGGGLKDPKPAKLYEWETAVSQWIFKQSY